MLARTGVLARTGQYVFTLWVWERLFPFLRKYWCENKYPLLYFMVADIFYTLLSINYSILYLTPSPTVRVANPHGAIRSYLVGMGSIVPAIPKVLV